MTPAFRPLLKPLVLALSLAGAGPALAIQFSLDNGLTGSVDTTLSYGISVRAASRDPGLFGIANGGTERSVNEDDGNLNYDKNKPFANLAKATVDLELKYGRFGFFGRGTAFYDFTNEGNDKLGPTAQDRVGKDVQGLDGFVSAAFEPGGKNLRLRAGRQVISWGESTFLPNGINVINPVDLSKLRVPGSELKEAFIPTAGLWGNLELTKDASLEGFYLTNHDKIKIDPRGTYFSNNDFASDDANRVIVGWGAAATSISRPRTRCRRSSRCSARPPPPCTVHTTPRPPSGRRAPTTAIPATTGSGASRCATSPPSSTTPSSACTT